MLSATHPSSFNLHQFTSESKSSTMQQTSRLFLRFPHFSSLPISPKFSQILQLRNSTLLPQNQPLYNYLIHHFKFQESKALQICNRFSSTQNQENPLKVFKYLKDLGFTDTQIIYSANMTPQILFASVEKTLKPKIDFLEQELGLSCPTFGKFISKHSTILTYSLTKRLRPNIEVIRNILSNHDRYNESGNYNLFRALRRCSYMLTGGDTHRKMVVNVSYFQSCGIVGTQLANFFVRAPRMFILSESLLKKLVSRVLDLGISYESRMFVHGLHTLSCISHETFLKKFGLFRSFGFTENECREMFKRVPMLFRVSEQKVRIGLVFFLETVGMERSELIRNAYCLMFSMEDRVVARYRVMKLLESKGVLKKEPRFLSVLRLSDEAFLEKYISKFPAHVEDLLFQYKGHRVDSSSD